MAKLSEQVYQRSFKIEPYGYKCVEVDSFLDELNAQIVVLESEVEKLKEKSEKLENHVRELEKMNKDYYVKNIQTQAKKVPDVNNADFNNIKLLERMTNLESMVQSLIDLQNKK